MAGLLLPLPPPPPLPQHSPCSVLPAPRSVPRIVAPPRTQACTLVRRQLMQLRFHTSCVRHGHDAKLMASLAVAVRCAALRWEREAVVDSASWQRAEPLPVSCSCPLIIAHTNTTSNVKKKRITYTYSQPQHSRRHVKPAPTWPAVRTQGAGALLEVG